MVVFVYGLHNSKKMFTRELEKRTILQSLEFHFRVAVFQNSRGSWPDLKESFCESIPQELMRPILRGGLHGAQFLRKLSFGECII